MKFSGFLLALVFIFTPLPATAADEALRDSVKQWAIEAVVTPLNFDATTYTARVNENRGLFTKRGCNSFYIEIDKHDFLHYVFEHDRMLITTPWPRVINVADKDQIVIQEMKIEEGHYIWEVDVPVTMTMYDGTFKYPFNALFTLKIVAPVEAPKNFIIDYADMNIMFFTSRYYEDWDSRRTRPECR